MQEQNFLVALYISTGASIPKSREHKQNHRIHQAVTRFSRAQKNAYFDKMISRYDKEIRDSRYPRLNMCPSRNYFTQWVVKLKILQYTRFDTFIHGIVFSLRGSDGPVLQKKLHSRLPKAFSNQWTDWVDKIMQISVDSQFKYLRPINFLLLLNASRSQSANSVQKMARSLMPGFTDSVASPDKEI